MVSSCVSFVMTLRIRLPLAGFSGLTCGCQAPPNTAARHIVSCNQFGKNERSDLFGAAFDSIFYDFGPGVHIEGVAPQWGSSRSARPSPPSRSSTVTALPSWITVSPPTARSYLTGTLWDRRWVHWPERALRYRLCGHLSGVCFLLRACCIYTIALRGAEAQDEA